MSLPPGTSRLPFSERLYRLLLRAYPRAFREEYEAEMLLVFRDVARDVRSQQGPAGMLRLWGDLLGDFVKTVCIQHVRNWMQQSGSNLALAGKGEATMALPFILDVAQHTDIGRKRTSNEDNLISVVPEDNQLLQSKGALFVVSDGMGGHARGEVASALTIEKVKEYYYQDTQHDIPEALREAVRQANISILQEIQATGAEEGSKLSMGATCVAAVLHEQTLYVANIGDSRVYVLHAGHLRQITRDHSIVARMVESGEITLAEARTHEKRNIIYRSLGQADIEVDLFSEPVQQSDTLILCTDGLCGVLEDDDLREIVEQYPPDESVQRLIARANAEGGPDNVTAIVVRVTAA